MEAVAGLVLASVFAGPARGQSDLKLAKLAADYWDARMEQFPMQATALGDYRFNDRLEDVSEKGRTRWRTRLEALLAQTKGLDAEGLSEEDRLTRALLERELERELLLLECDPHLMPLEPLDGPQVSFPLILVSQPFRNAKDYYDYARRLGAFRRHIANHIRNMREGMARGWVGPRSVVHRTLPQIRAQMAWDPQDTVFYGPARDVKALEDEFDRTNVVAQISDAIRDSVLPAFEELRWFVDHEYLPHCTKTQGIGALPGGEEAYKKLVRYHTTTDLSPDAIHEIGLSEVARIRGAMSKIKEQMKFEGDLDAFIAHMRTDGKYRFESSEELYKSAGRHLKRAGPLMRKLFERVPRAVCVMKEIEDFRAEAAPAAYYNPAPQDRAHHAYYYINTYKADERLRFTLEALTYHEAVPGHHFQIALHQESRELPEFRRHARFTAFIEGWALYAEKLGYEIGGYPDAASRYGQLTFEMWRACRLVVDTGIHAKGWSRERAIEYMANNTSLAMHDIEAEVDRYFAWPGQALAYKIGELKILELRKKAEETLGDKFDIRAFHEAVLSAGPMPLDLLESRVRAWIANDGP